MVSIRNNILCNAERALVDGDRDFSPAQPVIEYNLTFTTSPAPGEQNINNDTTQGGLREPPRLAGSAMVAQPTAPAVPVGQDAGAAADAGQAAQNSEWGMGMKGWQMANAR